MSLKLTYQLFVTHAVDGGGPVGFTGIGPVAEFSGVTGFVIVAGGTTPTGAQITTAITAVATDLNAQVVTNAANLAKVQGFETGGG